MFSERNKKKEERPGSSCIDRSSGSLNIRCTGCGRFPDPASKECIECICEAVADSGTSDCIRLTGVRDTILSGKAAEFFCLLAEVRKPISFGSKKGRCAKCPRSPVQIFDSAWETFPEIPFSQIRSRLYSDSRDGPECISCLQKTYAELTASEEKMRAVSALFGENGGRKE
jgi:bacterioferritin-associated ferredoxin